MKKILVFFFLLASQNVFAICPVEKKEKEITGGNFYFRAGPSNEPVRPRGDGRHKHWETGVDLCLSRGRVRFEGGVNFSGAATFDNLDAAAINLKLRARIFRSFYLEGVHQDTYALNKDPVPDPAARRPNSSVNFWAVGPRWDFAIGENSSVSVRAHYVAAGDEPVWFAYFTKPYSRVFTGVSVRVPGPMKTTLFADSELALHTLGTGRNVVAVSLERAITEHVVLEAKGKLVTNFGVPKGMTTFFGTPLQNGWGIFPGIKYRFGK